MTLFLSKHNIIWPIIIGGLDFSISDFAISVIVAPLLMSSILFISIYKSSFYPKFAQSLVEIAYQMLKLKFDATLQQAGQKYISFVFSLMFFIFSLNIMNLIPFCFPCTTQLALTLSIAVLVFILIISIGMKEHGILGFWGTFIPPKMPVIMRPILFCMELLSFFIRPLTLALRLASNMIVGHMILYVIASMGTGSIAISIITLLVCAAFTLFEIGIAFLQSYIFALLTCMYIAEIFKKH